MEQLLLTSRNLSKHKKQGKGTLSVFDLLKDIAKLENVFTEAAIPDVDLNLAWEECYTPLLSTHGFQDLISKKLYSYKFQYLAVFRVADRVLTCGSSNNCEHFEANMNQRLVFESSVQKSESVNCTWLLDMLLNAAQISKNPLRKEQLIWQQTANGYEFVLEATFKNNQLRERQVIAFENNFEHMSWEHYVSLK